MSKVFINILIVRCGCCMKLLFLKCGRLVMLIELGFFGLLVLNFIDCFLKVCVVIFVFIM